MQVTNNVSTTSYCYCILIDSSLNLSYLCDDSLQNTHISTEDSACLIPKKINTDAVIHLIQQVTQGNSGNSTAIIAYFP